MQYGKLTTAAVLVLLVGLNLYLSPRDGHAVDEVAIRGEVPAGRSGPSLPIEVDEDAVAASSATAIIRERVVVDDPLPPRFSPDQIESMVAGLESEIECMTEHARRLRLAESQSGLDARQARAVASSEYGVSLKIEVIRLLRSGRYLAIPVGPRGGRALPLAAEDGPVVMLPSVETDGQRYTPVVQVDTRDNFVLSDLHAAVVASRGGRR